MGKERRKRRIGFGRHVRDDRLKQVAVVMRDLGVPVEEQTKFNEFAFDKLGKRL